MRWMAPEWLLLFPVLVLAGWYWPRLRLARPLRGLCLALILLLLVHPELRHAGRGLDLWVLVDRSDSAAAMLGPRLDEWEDLLSGSKGKDDHLYFVDFADTPVLRVESEQTLFEGGTGYTRTGLALQYALSQMPSDRPARILILTDGFSTEPVADLANRLADQQIALDYRFAPGMEEGDVRLSSLRMPLRVQVAEPFLVEAEIAGRPDQTVGYTVLRGSERMGHGTVDLEGGVARLRFTDRLADAGAHRYRVLLQPETDAHPGNNDGERWIEVAGGPRVLLITGYADDPVAAALRRQGFELEVITKPGALHPGMLTGARAVLLNNVPAYRLPSETLEALDFFVRRQGGGLLMAGGRHSFGSGGYYESDLDDLLPVSMELKEEHRKLAVAMAIVLDRSGSMAAGVSGAPGLTKMDLANQGSARAIDLLGANDLVTVFAVDSGAHTIVPLSQVGKNRNELLHTVRRIESAGGGIYVYTGLRAAWEELQRAEVGQRHVILFADARDAEEPGDYKNLVAEMVNEGTTVSVIGLGTSTDSDAEFLKDIALRGNGRIFFNSNPSDLPSLFAQEVVTVARSAFIEEPVGVEPMSGWLELAARPLDWLDAVDGYNLSYLRPEATAAALSGDEYAAPLVAFWQRGVGRVAAVSFPLGGEFSAAVRAWPRYGDFVQTLTRWLMGEDLPPGVGLKTRLDGTQLNVDLFYDDRWEDRMARRPPEIHLAGLSAEEVSQHPWARLEPGHYRTSIPMKSRETVRGAIGWGTAALAFGPITAGLDAEWTFDDERVRELAELSRVSGGGERVDLSTVWKAPRRTAFLDLRPALLIALLLALLLEALVTRMGWALPRLKLRIPSKKLSSQRPRPVRKPEALSPPPPETKKPAISPPVPSEAEPDDSEHRRGRFHRAKRWGE